MNKQPVFNDPLRTKLTEGIKDKTEQPEVVVTRVEEIVCTHLVLLARELGERLAKAIFDKFTK